MEWWNGTEWQFPRESVFLDRGCSLAYTHVMPTWCMVSVCFPCLSMCTYTHTHSRIVHAAVPYRAHRAGRMGLGAGAVGQRRSTPVRLSFSTRACLTYAKSLMNCPR